MKKFIGIFLAAALALCLSPPTYAANETGAQTELSFTYSPAQPSYFVTVSADKVSSNQNRLAITVTELYPDGNENVITGTFLIPKNSAGTYDVGGYSVYVDIKGNVQIRKYEIVGNTSGGGTGAPDAAALVSVATAANNIIGMAETSKGSNVWVMSFTVDETYSDGETVAIPYTISVAAKNGNISGRCDLGAYTLIYDIAGNGSNVKDFRAIFN